MEIRIILLGLIASGGLALISYSGAGEVQSMRSFIAGLILVLISISAFCFYDEQAKFEKQIKGGDKNDQAK